MLVVRIGITSGQCPFVNIKSNCIASAKHSSLGKRGASFENDLKCIPNRSFLYTVYFGKKDFNEKLDF